MASRYTTSFEILYVPSTDIAGLFAPVRIKLAVACLARAPQEPRLAPGPAVCDFQS
jgi:hypothetical protein